MAEQPRSSAAEKAHSVIEQRLFFYVQIQVDYSTPLFHKELLYAAELYQEALQDPVLPILEQPYQLKHLDSINAQLKKHWVDLNTSLHHRANLLHLVHGYQELLAKSILLDYAGVSQQIKGSDFFVSSTVEILNKYSNTGERSNEDVQLYEEWIVTPIKETMLDQGHVEKRLRLATEQQRPSSGIYRLINECDWPSLATMLIDDRKLILTLRDQKVPGDDWNILSICDTALLEMNKIRDRYFMSLTSASTYAMNKRARGRSARKAAGLPLPPEKPGWHSRMGQAASMAAKSVCDTIIGTLGRMKTTRGPETSAHSGFSKLSSPRSSMDEKDSLFTSRKA